jgi:hypothetical protein
MHITKSWQEKKTRERISTYLYVLVLTKKLILHIEHKFKYKFAADGPMLRC